MPVLLLKAAHLVCAHVRQWSTAVGLQDVVSSSTTYSFKHPREFFIAVSVPTQAISDKQRQTSLRYNIVPGYRVTREGACLFLFAMLI